MPQSALEKKIQIEIRKNGGKKKLGKSIFQKTDKQWFDLSKKKNKTKLDYELLSFHDADRRLDIALNKMNDITNRLHDLEEERTKALRKKFLEVEVKKNPNKELIKELEGLKHVDEKAPEIYQEIANGYRSMSRRKNELSQERDATVKFVEEEEKKMKETGKLK